LDFLQIRNEKTRLAQKSSQGSSGADISDPNDTKGGSSGLTQDDEWN